MDFDDLEKLTGWPGNENTFLMVAGNDARLVVTPADMESTAGMMAALDWGYATYGPAFADSDRPSWHARRWHGCRTTGFADWIGDATGFHGVRSIMLLDRRGNILDEIGLEDS